jgi:FAD/FMN-containing dehydrogenase
MATQTQLKPTEWSELQQSLRGDLITSDSPSYEAARKVWNGMIDRRPGAIARCRSTSDVVTAINFARTHGLFPAVRGGGHSAAGLGMIDDGLVIDLADLNEVQIDAENRIARVGGGATWRLLDQAAAVHGLATTGGVISTTGVGGLTLGGGVGNLMRSYGLACDNMIGAEVVLADGSVVRTSESEHSDLLWGLRGGGGNFGVVTEFEFRLHPVTNVVGGMLIHPRERAIDVLRHYRSACESAPDELGIFAGLMSSPEGDPIAAYLTCLNGTEGPGLDKLEELRRFGPPIADMVAEMPYVDFQTLLDEGFPSGIAVYWKSHFLTGLPDDAIEILVSHANQAPSPLSVVLLEQLGGKVARIGRGETAFDHRGAPYNLALMSRWTQPEEAEANIAWVRGLFDAMRPYAHGVYVNYLGVDDAPERVRDAYGAEKYERLVELKRQYDPTNLFRHNQNISPV